MTDAEKAQRTTVLVEMFLGLGREAGIEQIAYYGNLTKHVPLDALRDACRIATLNTVGGWAPGPGDILRAALELAPGELNPGHERSKPRWYQRSMRRLYGDERPREIGQRSGATDSSAIVDIASEVK